MRIGTLFSGIGAPEQAASRVWPEHEIAFTCEWDKYARQSYLANYDIDEEHFYIDVKEMDGTKYRGKCDILIGGSPCQAFSIAGLRNGTDDERGQLIYQYVRIVEEVKAPVIVYENVKGMMSINSGKTVMQFMTALRQIGYYCHYSVVNTKDYGVPQNRERLFMVGFLDHEQYYRFQFAEKVPLEKRLRDILEPAVDEKYYLSHKMVNYLSTKDRAVKPYDGTQSHSPCMLADYHKTPTDGFYIKEPQEGVIGMLDIKGNECIRRVYGVDGAAPCLQTMQGGNREPKIVEPKIVAMRGRNPINPKSRQSGLETVQMLEANENGTSNVLTTVQKDNLLDDGYRIRKLTPRECLRLQDFPDTFKQVVSDSQMYKQAGNSMTVAVVEMIFRQIDKVLKGEHCAGQGSLF